MNVHGLHMVHGLHNKILLLRLTFRNNGGKSVKNMKTMAFDEMPGPQPVPILGNVWRFIPNIGQYDFKKLNIILDDVSKTYGRCARFSGLIDRDLVYVNDIYDIQKVLSEEATFERFIGKVYFNYKYSENEAFFRGCYGLSNVKLKDRKIFYQKAKKHFQLSNMNEIYHEKIQNVAEGLVKKIDQLKNSRSEMPENFVTEVMKYSIEGISILTFDAQICAEDTRTLLDFMNFSLKNYFELNFSSDIWKYVNTPLRSEFLKHQEDLIKIIKKNIRIANNKISNVSDDKNTTVMQRFLISNPNNSRPAEILAYDLLFNGAAKMAFVVCSFLYQLAINPNVQEKLFLEISKIFPDNREIFDVDKIEELAYLKACIKEHFRLHHVFLGSYRISTKEITIGGYRIPEGTGLFLNYYSLCRQEKYFHKSNQFDPDRWLRPENINKINPDLCFSYGFGEQPCIAKNFAEILLQSFIAKIVQKYKIEYHYRKLEYHQNPYNAPDGPLRLKMLKRN